MTELMLLPPNQLSHVLRHDQIFTQAIALLKDDWEPDANQMFHQPMTPNVIELARALQQANLVPGRWQLSDYRQVSELIAQHGNWFSPAARQALLALFA